MRNESAYCMAVMVPLAAKSSIFLLLVLSITTPYLTVAATILESNTLRPNIKQTCETLKATVLTFLPSSSNYTALATKNWSGTAWSKPSCIVQPSSSSQAQEVVSVLSKGGVSFAVRSGGHMPSPLAANTDGGVLIDLSGLKSIQYDARKSEAKIGAGLKWGEVYAELERSKVTVVGGRVLDVGVGGLILGSGLSYLSDLYGLACDNVVNFEVVLAGGKLVNASARENQDLFWALKGGLNNFGLVTSFTLKTYSIYQVWGGVKLYNYTDLPKLLRAANEYQSTPTKDPYANFMLQAFPTNQSIGVVLNMVYLRPVPSPAAFAPFYNIPTTGDLTRVQTLREMMSGQGVPDIPRWDWRTTSFKPSEGVYERIEGVLAEAPEVATIAGLTGGTLALGLQPISTLLVDAGREKGGNALGLERMNQTWWVLDTGHWLEKDDEVAHEATKRLINKINDEVEEEQAEVDYLFMNDASWDQDVIASYGENNVAKLKAVRRKYDPQFVFTNLVFGGFKLG
ncbi:putative FAD-binding oxidoreductase [Aaosphaeria arxii CBS 175.79]|uniref:Putative FAD-binding oxidoreductase n=1 Tax=Aaosphaeria arxii CBS 175.79 TaxID=1450172 RepID=A0A6A5XMG6_9PLEO|nr:putative FAD-binding oxidoreductase [Aaosphaeria arxii CBS 175.79]KAF2014438.1 putative FAD-binding oxidoreductase [Aaosphaeria arxii CBS 175.79]